MSLQNNKISLRDSSVVFEGTYLDGTSFIFNFSKLGLEELPALPPESSIRSNLNFSGNGFVYANDTQDETPTANWIVQALRGINLPAFEELNTIWFNQQNLGFENSSLTLTSAQGNLVNSFNVATLNNNSFYGTGTQDGTTTTGNVVEIVFNLANSKK